MYWVRVHACSFQNHQIFPGSKITHFNRIRKQTRLAFEDMIFFDDGTHWNLALATHHSTHSSCCTERRNVKEVGAMGVTAVLVDNGLTCADFLRGMCAPPPNLSVPIRSGCRSL